MCGMAVATVTCCLVSYSAEHWLQRVPLAGVSQEVQQAMRVVHVAKPVLALVWCPMLVSCTFLVYFSCDLHKYELRWYAAGLAETLANDDLGIDPLTAITRTEEMVTNRLRHASSSWASVSLCSGVFMAACFIITAAQMLTAPLQLQDVYRHSAYLLSMLVTMVFLISPIAQVAETFEYDVLRALNKPLIVNRAQQYLGQQLLPTCGLWNGASELVAQSSMPILSCKL